MKYILLFVLITFGLASTCDNNFRRLKNELIILEYFDYSINGDQISAELSLEQLNLKNSDEINHITKFTNSVKKEYDLNPNDDYFRKLKETKLKEITQLNNCK